MRQDSIEDLLKDWENWQGSDNPMPSTPTLQEKKVVSSPNIINTYQQALTPFEQLTQFSVTGQSRKLKRQMLADQFVLNGIAIMGQWTTIYGAPNSGKTLITNWLLRETLLSDVVDGELLFYVNADDTYRGLVEKIALAEEWGMHIIAPHHNNFAVNQVPELMNAMGSDGSAHGAVIILDTLKKFTDLMDKRSSSEFGVAARGFVSAGGTLIALAHTNKHKNAEGRAIYAGTSDIVADSDCCFIINKVSKNENSDGSTTHIVEFDNHKARGDVEPKVGFKYEKRHGQAYSGLIDTVKRLDGNALEDLKDKATVQAALDSDELIIQTICKLIEDGVVTKDKIIKCAHELAGESNARIRSTLDHRTGNLYDLGHRWSLKKEAHNRHVYAVLPTP